MKSVCREAAGIPQQSLGTQACALKGATPSSASMSQKDRILEMRL